MKCAGCMKTIKDSLSAKCMAVPCEKSFCTQCINVSSLTSDRKKQWRCPDCCASQRKGGDNSLTPVRSGGDNVTLRKKTEVPLEPVEPNLNKLSEQLQQLIGAFSALKSQLEEVTVSLSHSHERMDDIVLQLGAVDKRLKYLEKRDEEVVTLQNMVIQLQSELRAESQSNLRNELEILGVPETTSENVHHIVQVAAKKLGVELEDRDIDWVTRVGPRRPPVAAVLPEDGARMPRPIVVRLLRRSKKDQFLKASKQRRNLSSSDLEVYSTPAKNVFFNERLTKENRVLFRASRTRAKMLGFVFCWCSQGAIFVRQKEGRPAIQIRSHIDLEHLLPYSTKANKTKDGERPAADAVIS